MNIKQRYVVLAAVLVGEVLLFALLTGVALSQPAAGAFGLLVAAAVVFYYSARHPTPFGVIASIFNTILLSYFSQSRGLPTVLLFLLICGVSPHVEQLSPSLARAVFAAAYTVTAVALGALVSGSTVPGVPAALCYVVCAAVGGFAGARFLLRPSPLEPANG